MVRHGMRWRPVGRWLLEAVSLGELTTEDVAKMVAFLCSDDTMNVTGAAFHVDGRRGVTHIDSKRIQRGAAHHP